MTSRLNSASIECALLVLGACGTSAIPDPKSQPDIVYAEPCDAADDLRTDDGVRTDQGPFRDFLATPPSPTKGVAPTKAKAPAMCCPKGFVAGSMAHAAHRDCPDWQCCPIWDGMGNPPLIPAAPLPEQASPPLLP
jgi:hypothetical protein